MVAIIFNDIVNGSNCDIPHLFRHHGRLAINNSVHLMKLQSIL